MKKISLAGQWKLRGDFMDVTADKFAKVLEKMDAPPVPLNMSSYVSAEELKEFEANIEKSKIPGYKVNVTNGHPFPSKTGYINMQVPGDVITALVDSDIIKEPLLKTNTRDCLWVKDLCWWMTREFEITQEMFDEDIINLRIEMLDFNAHIIINDEIISNHKNAFCAYNENIKRFLKVGTNKIVIRITSGMELNFPRDSVSYYSVSQFAVCDQRVHTRKPQYTYGWDWCQPVPTCGIGRDIRIEAFSGARVTASRVDTLSIDKDEALLDFVFEVEKTNMVASADVDIDFSLTLDGETLVEKSITIHAVGGLNYVSKKIKVKNPKLWWPNGYGKQNLYAFNVSCTKDDVKIVADTKKIGIRTVELDLGKLDDGTRKFNFMINGVKVFCKGGNWVPTDSVYLRTPDVTYKTLVSEAAAANFNMLRMWGGGTYEPECFYDYCAEYGILIMHDFMYACAFYPDENSEFLYEATKEANYQTKRLAHFPCIVMWTGNNEIAESHSDWFPDPVKPHKFYGEKIFNYVQPEAVHNNCPTLPYMPSSPYMGERANIAEEGDIHAWNWFARHPEGRYNFLYELEAFDRFNARFSSEYGFYGALPESTFKRVHDGEEVEFRGEIWNHHGEQPKKRGHIDPVIERFLTDFDKLDAHSYVIFSGIMQGLLYLELAEALRSKHYGSGNLIWMYNDCWPETGWTIIDYYMTRKVSFYFLKRAFATKKLIIRESEKGALVTVLNETPYEVTEELNISYITFDGKESGKIVKTITAKPHSFTQFEVEIEGDLTQGVYVATMNGFERGDSIRAYYRDVKFPKAKISLESHKKCGDDMEITIKAENYVPFVNIKASDDRLHMTDNCFTMLPNEVKTVLIKNCDEVPELEAFEPAYREGGSRYE